MARFLLRFDDIAPGMNWNVWSQVERILEDSGVSPLLAVVPANADPELNVAEPHSRFWEQVRSWQLRGWSIGLHGFEHRYTTRSSGIVGRNPYSEFAGLSEAEQRRKLEAAIGIFRQERVTADAFVAPAHSFDETTTGVLKDLGVECISDGYALHPFVCRRGLFWVPQQIGRFRPLPFGVWTVCLHINQWTGRDVAAFRGNVAAYRSRIVSLAEVRRRYGGRNKHFSDRMFESSFRLLRALRPQPSPVETCTSHSS